MCGIFGVYSANLVSSEVMVFRHLMAANYHRGRDSTGVMMVQKNGDVTHHKMARSAYAALESPEVHAFLGQKGPMLLLGHCRAATIGSVTAENAHPFAFKNVIGVHNGTIRGTFPHSSEYGTDSEALYRNINDDGLIPGIEESVGSDDAFALAYVDKVAGSLNFIHNGKRSLYFSYLSSKNTLVWSSDFRDLDYVLDRVMNYSDSYRHGWDKEKKDLFGIRVNNRLTLDLGANAGTASIIAETIASNKKKGYTTTTVHGHAPWMDDDYGDYTPGVGWTGKGYSRSKPLTEFNGPNYDIDSEDSNNTAAEAAEAAKTFMEGYVQTPAGTWVPASEEAAKVVQTFPVANGTGGSTVSGSPGGTAGSTVASCDTSGATPSKDPGREQPKGKTVLDSSLSWLHKAPPKVASHVQEPPRMITATPKTGTKVVVLPKKSVVMEPLTAAERAFRLTEGCFCCSESPPHIDASRVHWLDRECYVCEACREVDWVKHSFGDLDAPQPQPQTVASLH